MEVSCRATRILFEAAESVGIAPERIADASAFPLEHLLDPTKRIDWPELAAICTRTWELCDRDPERIRLVGEATVHAPASEFLKKIGRIVATPRLIYVAGNKWVAPVLFPQVRLTTEDLGDDRLRITGELAPSLTDCEAFFWICTSALAAQPRVMGLPDAVVESTITPRRAVSIVSLPRSRSILERVRRGIRSMREEAAILDLLEQQRRELDRSFAATMRAAEDFRLVLENLPDMVLIHRGGKILWVNRALVTTLGYDDARELVGRSNLDIVHPNARADVAARMRRPPLDAELPNLAPFRLLRKDGVEIIAEIAPTQEVTFGGSPARLVAGRDVTERARMQKQLVLADRMAQIGVLAAGVAHEINNPLAYAMGSVELAAASVAREDRDGANAALATAIDGLERVRTIVKDLKTFSRGDDDPLGPVDVRAALESTLTLAAKLIARRARIVRAYEASPMAWGNAARLGQVFLNLVVNAVEAMPERNASAPDNELRLRVKDGEAGRVVVEIEDTGEGIAKENLTRIFEPFFTTKPVGGGTGLGLSVCHQIVTSLGGTIDVRSTRGAGTTFRVTLPAAPEPSRASFSANAPPSSRRRRARVLVIDDEPHFATLLKHVLESHDVAVAPSARAALPLLENDPGYDVIVCDLMMPDLSGPDLHAELARTRPELCDRMIFMTGGAFTDRARDFLARIPNRCLDKPFDARELIEAVESRLTP